MEKRRPANSLHYPDGKFVFQGDVDAKFRHPKGVFMGLEVVELENE